MNQVMTKTDQLQIPQPGKWRIDNAHSTVGFSVRHMVISKVRGRFGDFSGEILGADPLENSSVSVTIDASSIDTGVEKRDQHLRSGDFLEVDKFPTLRFDSTNIQRTGETTGTLTGDLTIRDATRPVTLDVEFLGLVDDKSGTERGGFTARTKIDREDWGLTWNMGIETGGVVVSKEVEIEIEVALVREQ